MKENQLRVSLLVKTNYRDKLFLTKMAKSLIPMKLFSQTALELEHLEQAFF